MNRTTTGSAVLDVDLSTAEKVATGNDSIVYRAGDRAMKEYQKLSFDEVARYVELHNRAMAALERLQYTAQFPIRGVAHTIDTRGIPVDEIGLSPAGRPVAVSEWVEAANLDKLLQKPELFAEHAKKQISNPSLRQFGLAMNALFGEENPTRVQDEFIYHVSILSRLLDRELGVFGVYIGKYNAKLVPHDAEPRITLVITDIAVYIDRLKYERRA